MKKVAQIILVGLFILALPQVNFATHIVGGEMNYTCLGNNMYEIQLTVFRDCETGIPDFDDPASIGIFGYNDVTDTYFLDTDIASFGQLLIPSINNDTLDPTLFDTCLVIPPNVCVNTTTYVDTVFLPFQTGGYTLAYQRCCRNQSIQNIIDPLDTGATYPISISEKALNECNSNAVFNEWPPIYICVNEPILFDHSATDIDGDSLVYRLCVPFSGASPDSPMPQPPSAPPYNEVVWVDPPYNLNNVMGGIPLAVDPATGFMTGTPNTIGQFVVGVCVDEYRDGELISTTRRDFQYNVGVCANLIAALFVPEVSCEGLEVTFDNTSSNADNFYWEFNDPTNPNASSDDFSPTYIYSDTGMYTVMLVAEKTFPPCIDTTFTSFSIFEDTLEPDFGADLIDCNFPISFSLSDFSSDTIFAVTDWEWIVDGVLFSTDQNPPDFIGNNTMNDEVSITLVITNEKGCQDSITQILDLGINLNYDNIYETCEVTNTTTLDVEIVGNPNIDSWNWMPSAGIISGGNANTPTVDLTVTDTYYFSVSYGNGCVFEDSIIVDNSGLDLMLMATADPDTINSGETTQLEVTGNDLDIFDWEPSSTLDDPSIFNPIANPEGTIEYTTIVTDINGCMDTISVLVVVLNTICEEPFLFMPNAFTPNGDNENDILFVEGNIIDEMHLVIYNRWGERVFESKDKNIGWDGYYKNELLEPDVYGYYLTIRCINGEDYFKKGNINLIR